MSIKKYIKKTAGKVYKAGSSAVKKRYMKGKSVNVGQIVKDVAFLKSVLNPEKKRIDIGVNNAAFGQILNSASVSGAMLSQVAFGTSIVQGITSSTRNGNSIKMSSIIFKARLNQQTSTNGPVRYRLTIFTCKGAPQSTANIVSSNAFYDNDVFTGVVDYNSNRNPDQFPDFQILGQRTGKLAADTLSGQIQYADVSMPIKCSKHMRWDNNGNLQEFPVYFYAVADTGDAGTAATGINMQYSFRAYFYDN